MSDNHLEGVVVIRPKLIGNCLPSVRVAGHITRNLSQHLNILAVQSVCDTGYLYPVFQISTDPFTYAPRSIERDGIILALIV